MIIVFFYSFGLHVYFLKCLIFILLLSAKKNEKVKFEFWWKFSKNLVGLCIYWKLHMSRSEIHDSTFQCKNIT